MDFKSRYIEAIRGRLGDDENVSDVQIAERATEAERRLGFAFPAALREYYDVGFVPQLVESALYATLTHPDHLRVEGSMLIIDNCSEEDQGIRVSSLVHADPQVFHRVRPGTKESMSWDLTDPSVFKWKRSKCTVSELIVGMIECCKLM